MHRPAIRKATVAFLAASLIVATGCSDDSSPDDPGEGEEEPTRAEAIPEGAVKVTPETDAWPPAVHSAEWSDPVPMPGPVNTASVEDAPVITADGKTFLFYFTPDGNLPAEEQLLDGVSGIWWCTREEGGAWTEPVRARLATAGELHLDGPFAVQGDTLWFGSARIGNYRDLDIYTAVLSGGEWGDWRNAGERLNAGFDVGELYVSGDGSLLCFGRVEGGLGGYDLWTTGRTAGGDWTEPVNLGAPVNTALDEYQPYLSSDGSELYFTRSVSAHGSPGPAIYRSEKIGDGWSEPEEIVSCYVGDPGLDAGGNLYFTHVFFDSTLHKIEADIYVAYRR